MKEKSKPNGALIDLIKRSGVPMYFLAINMRTPEIVVRELLKCDLTDKEVFAILDAVIACRREMQKCRITPWSREDYDI